MRGPLRTVFCTERCPRSSARQAGLARLALGLSLALSLCLTISCQDLFDKPADDVITEPDLARFVGAGVDASCSADETCRDGLACIGGVCTPTGDKPVDTKCLLSAECAPGLNCGWSGFCTAVEDLPDTDECSSSAECASGQYCKLTGLSGSCATPLPAAGDLDATCYDTADCMAGLVCSAVSATCVPGALLLNPDLFIGVACPEEEEEGEDRIAFGVRMSIPRGNTAEDGFYSLPFPNDVRFRDGHVDLSNHPVPGPGIIGFDATAAIIDAIETDLDGFSVMPAVFFRLTRALAPETLVISSAGGAPASVLFVNLDSGEAVPFTARFHGPRGKYQCGKLLVVRPVWSRPLAAKTPYAVILTTALRAGLPNPDATDDEESEPALTPGDHATPLDDLALLLGEAAPDDPDELHAWEAYAKLRAYLSGATLGREDVAGAAVFTTGDPTRLMPTFRAAVRADDAPTLAPDGLVVCGEGVHSPCATPDWASTAAAAAGKTDPRECPQESFDSHSELHARIRIPVFQEGTRPYESEGGAVALDAKGDAVVVDHEEVCIAFSIPKGVDPGADGWPVLLHAHGTNGAFRKGVARYAVDAAAMGVAVVAMDQPMHGPRRGGDGEPGPLFYNYANPRAAKGNLYQGAADNFALLRFFETFDGPLASLGDQRFDEERVVFMGHSQGGTTGPIFAPYEDLLLGAVFTGAGASLVYGLLGKEKPYNASVGMRISLQEVDIDADHVVLNLFQFYFDAADPLVHVPGLYRTPAGEALHVLNVFGWDDGYTPWRTSAILAAAMGGAMGTPANRPTGLETDGLDPVADLGLKETALPISGNVDAGGGAVTGVSVAHASDGSYDGHFVGVRNPAAKAQIAAFLQDLFAGAVPTVPTVSN